MDLSRHVPLDITTTDDGMLDTTNTSHPEVCRSLVALPRPKPESRYEYFDGLEHCPKDRCETKVVYSSVIQGIIQRSGFIDAGDELRPHAR